MANLTFNVNDWYWQVLGDTNVWSSARFAYVAPDDSAYQDWIAAGGTLTSIESQSALGGVMAIQRIPNYLNIGLQVAFASDASLSSTYALDAVTVTQLGTLARDAACGFGLPLQMPSLDFPDVNGTVRAFTSQQLESLYIAMRDYVAGVNFAIAALVHGGAADLPTQPVAIFT